MTHLAGPLLVLKVGCSFLWGGDEHKCKLVSTMLIIQTPYASLSLCKQTLYTEITINYVFAKISQTNFSIENSSNLGNCNNDLFFFRKLN